MLIGWDQTIYASDARARRSFLLAVRERGYEPLPYGEREKLKREGWCEVYDDSLSLPVRVAGAEKVLRAWYDRSLAAAYLAGKRYWKNHPDFARYAAMTLEQARGLGQRLFPEEVMRELEAKYGLEFGLPAGSYWLPKSEWKAELDLGVYRRSDPEVLVRIRRFIKGR
jgi:hypothetical protein